MRAAEYYAHPQNQFWRLLGTLLREPLAEMDYAKRLKTLLRHRIGLWDVIATCRRPGSLDSDIRDEQGNDFDFLHDDCPQLRRIGFNGLKAGRLVRMFDALGYETVLLPSSSPAYTLPFAKKLTYWQALLLPENRPST